MKQNNKNRKILKQFGGEERETEVPPPADATEGRGETEEGPVSTEERSEAAASPSAAPEAKLGLTSKLEAVLKEGLEARQEALAAAGEAVKEAESGEKTLEEAAGQGEEQAESGEKTVKEAVEKGKEGEAAGEEAESPSAAAGQGEEQAEGGAPLRRGGAAKVASFELKRTMESYMELTMNTAFQDILGSLDSTLDNTVVIIEDLYDGKIRFFDQEVFTSDNFQKNKEGNLGVIDITNLAKNKALKEEEVKSLQLGDKLLSTDNDLYTVKKVVNGTATLEKDRIITKELDEFIEDTQKIDITTNNANDYLRYVKYIDIKIRADGNVGGYKVREVDIKKKTIGDATDVTNQLTSFNPDSPIHIIPYKKFKEYVTSFRTFINRNGHLEKFSIEMESINKFEKLITDINAKIINAKISKENRSKLSKAFSLITKYGNLLEYTNYRFKTLVFSITLENITDTSQYLNFIKNRDEKYLQKLEEINQDLKSEYDTIKDDQEMKKVIPQVKVEDQGDRIANKEEEEREDQEKDNNIIEIEIQDNNDGNSFSITNLKDLIKQVNKLINETNLNLIKAEIDPSKEVEEGKGEEGKGQAAAAAPGGGGGGKIYNSGKDFGNIKYKHSFKRRGQKLKRRIKNKHSVDKKNKKKQSSRKK